MESDAQQGSTAGSAGATSPATAGEGIAPGRGSNASEEPVEWSHEEARPGAGAEAWAREHPPAREIDDDGEETEDG